MSRSEQFEGFVLAGGKSSRMGTDKAFLKIGEKTFVENSIDALKPNCRKVSVVLNNTQTDFIDKLPPETPYIFDIFENRGALGGIHAALSACKTEFAIILAVDLPFVTCEVINSFCEIALESKDASAFLPLQTDGRLQPLCAVYRRSDCLPNLVELLKNEKSTSVKRYLETIETVILKESSILSGGSWLQNINSKSDIESFGLNAS